MFVLFYALLDNPITCECSKMKLFDRLRDLPAEGVESRKGGTHFLRPMGNRSQSEYDPRKGWRQERLMIAPMKSIVCPRHGRTL